MLRGALTVLLSLVLLTSNALASPAPSTASLARAFPAPPILAAAGLVMDASTGEILAAKNPHLHRPMASTTKIMTGLLALELGHLSDRIVVPGSAFNFESDATVMGLRPGEVVTLRDLLYGLLLPSGADAANTIAIHYAGSEARFVDMMNHEAQLLGMRDTHYATPHGLTAPNQYTSVIDLAILAQYVSAIPTFMKIVSTRQYEWNGHLLLNINHVISWYPGADGIKPGFTDDAGLCQVLDAHRGGRHVIVTLLDTPNLVTDARNLLNFGLRDYTWIQTTLPGDNPGNELLGRDAAGPYLYFPGTGHYLRGTFWKTYLADGGAQALGFPRTEPLQAGSARVQYFENGALSLDPRTGRVHRLPLGLTPVPTATPTATPQGTPTPTPVPVEGTVGTPGTATATVAKPKRGATATPGSRTPTPVTTPPAVTPTPTPVPKGHTAALQAINAFARAHPTLLGAAIGTPWFAGRYAAQAFVYGAVAYDGASKRILMLPIGDRLLAARHYLPAHAGNVYPANFASTQVLQALGWTVATRR